MPQIYVESDSDATSCYLFFCRLGYKADLINSVVAQTHNLPDSLNGDVSETLVGVCEVSNHTELFCPPCKKTQSNRIFFFRIICPQMRSRISGVSMLCKRFAAVLRRCDVETFLNMGRLYPEIAPLEKRVNMHIDLLRRDEFKVMECVSDIVK